MRAHIPATSPACPSGHGFAQERDAEVVQRARVAAGLSLGEYCALVAAGAISFSDGLKVRIQHRAHTYVGLMLLHWS
jgi:malonyl CoA-acyl carrier protein transacylase